MSIEYSYNNIYFTFTDITNLSRAPAAVTGNIDTNENDQMNDGKSQSNSTTKTTITHPKSPGHPSRSAVQKPPALLWLSFPRKLREACDQRAIPRPQDKTQMVHTIADYCRDDSKDKSCASIRTIVSSICKKYPDSFSSRLGSRIVGDGIKILITPESNKLSRWD